MDSYRGLVLLEQSVMTNNESLIKEVMVTSLIHFLSDNKQQPEVTVYGMWRGEHLQ